VVADELLSSDYDAMQRGTRSGSYRRSRVSVLQATSYLSELEFTRAFRMSPESFGQLLLLLMPRLRRDEAQGFRSSGWVVEPAVRLGVTLRVLEGASYIDIMLTFRIAKPTVFDVFWSTVQVIN
jgi:hypothetical protein